jgi:hypothetical protein
MIKAQQCGRAAQTQQTPHASRQGLQKVGRPDDVFGIAGAYARISPNASLLDRPASFFNTGFGPVRADRLHFTLRLFLVGFPLRTVRTLGNAQASARCGAPRAKSRVGRK